MRYPIEKKLVVGVSTNALFNLEIEDKIFTEEGTEKYRIFQEENKNKILEKGLAFPFIRRFLNINNVFPEEKPVEVVLLSKNSAETGVRAFNSIKEYNLDITRAAFTSGKSPYQYIPAFNISLFLSTNSNDVKNAINLNYPAGIVLKTDIHDNEDDIELRIAFDFDGVIADDSSEKIYQEKGRLSDFEDYEKMHKDEPINNGLLADFLKKISYFQKLENKKKDNDKDYKQILRTAIITARSAPTHERAINTLKNLEVDVDEMFFLGGIEKKRILEVLKPHLFIDDQIGHLDKTIIDVPLVHIPFGIVNKK